MCEVNWALILEYLKVLFSWPPMALMMTVLFIYRFRKAIDDFLNRVVEGNIFGQAFKAVPPRDQKAQHADENRLVEAAAGAAPPDVGGSLPPELASDPQAPAAITYVQNNPVQTVIEYKRLLFSYNSERLFNLIYGSQVELLCYLAEHGESGATLSELVKFHDVYRARSGTAGYLLRDYINFLVNFGVVRAEPASLEEQYRITPDGVSFLSYIKSQYPQAWNTRPY